MKNNRVLLIHNSFLPLLYFFFLLFPLFAQQNQNTEVYRREVISYGTETEIASLIQTIRTENVDYLDEDFIRLSQTTRNQEILTRLFGFFGDNEKNGLESRAMRAVTERENETNQTIYSAIDYLGKLKVAEAVPVILELLDTEERRFLLYGFRAIGRASSSDKELADETALFLMDYYDYRNPGSDLYSIIITSLGDTGSPLAVPFIADIAVNSDERVPLRIAALNALSVIGDDKAIDAILNCVGANDPNVRSAAVAALSPFSGEAVDNAILDAFRDSYYRTRLAAAQASRERLLEAAVPYLKFRAERDDVANVKDEAIRALGAIASAEAVDTLESLFTESRSADRIRILSSEMLMKIDSDRFFSRIVLELNDAKTRNQNALYNGFLKVVGEAVLQGNKTEVERVAHSFMQNGAIVEKLYGLDLAANNNLNSLSEQIIALSRDRNESLSRRARNTAEKLGIEIPEESK
ncbi:MAG: HEAT repeat domain-containing protein [Treponema sp.]|nr:HEAT repeat domain-containing protein [Treponema sp.]